MFKTSFPLMIKFTVKGQTSTWEEECTNLKQISGVFSGQSTWEDDLASMKYDEVKFSHALPVCFFLEKNQWCTEPLESPNLAEETKPNQIYPCVHISIWFHLIYQVDSFKKVITPPPHYLLLSYDAYCDKNTNKRFSNHSKCLQLDIMSSF